MSAPELPDDWNEKQQKLFMRVYRFLVGNMDSVCHPLAPQIKVEHWQTIAHNAAFVAAECIEHGTLRIIDDHTQEVLAETPDKVTH